MATKPTMERRTSKRLERKNEAAPYKRDGSGSTGLTAYMEKSNLDGAEKPDSKEEDLGPSRSISIFGKKKDKAPKLPPNWKKAKDKEGKLYYYNTVTQQRTHEVTPALPPGRACLTLAPSLTLAHPRPRALAPSHSLTLSPSRPHRRCLRRSPRGGGRRCTRSRAASTTTTRRRASPPSSSPPTTPPTGAQTTTTCQRRPYRPSPYLEPKRGGRGLGRFTTGRRPSRSPPSASNRRD